VKKPRISASHLSSSKVSPLCGWAIFYSLSHICIWLRPSPSSFSSLGLYKRSVVFPTAACPHYHDNATDPAARRGQHLINGELCRHRGRIYSPRSLLMNKGLLLLTCPPSLIAAYLISDSMSAEMSISRASDIPSVSIVSHTIPTV
jgi:hypothetical protein